MQGHKNRTAYLHARGTFAILPAGGTGFEFMSNEEVIHLLNCLLRWGKESQ